MDRTKLSDRKAAFVLTETAKSLGHDEKELNINRSSIHSQRESYRVNFARSAQDKFDPTVSLTVHWDGKLIPPLTDKEKVDRLAVLVTGLRVDQLLAFPKLESGNGIPQADALMHALQKWNIIDCVKAMSLCTTSSNTGNISGAFPSSSRSWKEILYSLLAVIMLWNYLFGMFSTHAWGQLLVQKFCSSKDLERSGH